MIGTLASFGIEALSKVRTNRKTLADMNVGLLFGINSDGKAIPADSSTGVRAVGIANCGTEYAYGVAREFNKTDKVNAGKEVNAEQFGIINVAADSFTQLQIGAPIYLSTAGSFTLTEPTTVGHLSQKVGKVYSRASVQIDLTQDSGTIVGVDNFTVFEVSTAGALSTKGISLVTTGSGALALTLGAPTIGTQVRIKLVTDGGGNATVTTGTGISFDGTNNTAVFADALDELVLGYKSATQWIIIENVGAVALSDV
jgi:hypothetical protein